MDNLKQYSNETDAEFVRRNLENDLASLNKEAREEVRQFILTAEEGIIILGE
jgi:hypothetical protein